MSIKKIPSTALFLTDIGWRTSRYHFSFADYHDPEKMDFGVLRALNDETIQSGNGFDLHPHSEMEILSYCVQGELNHKDNMGNDVTIHRGEIQYLCAGSGIMHSEMNSSTDLPLRFIQIWIQPKERGLIPHYERKEVTRPNRLNKWHLVASDKGLNGELQINQDANVFVAEISQGEQVEFAAELNRQGYLVCIEGHIGVNGIELERYDALQISEERMAVFKAYKNSHLLLVEMATLES